MVAEAEAGSGGSSKCGGLESHDLRKPGEKAPVGADSGPGEIEIMFPVLARCILMSQSGGRGAVRGVRDPEPPSRSYDEYLFVDVGRPAERRP
jgi:hypothetical protein